MLAALRAGERDADVRIGPETCRSQCDGTRLDAGTAIAGLPIADAVGLDYPLRRPPS